MTVILSHDPLQYLFYSRLLRIILTAITIFLFNVFHTFFLSVCFNMLISKYMSDILQVLNFITQRLRISCLCYILLVALPSRRKITLGMKVQIIQKQDQRAGKLTDGIVKRILTSSNSHPYGIKVELENGKIGRVQNII